MKRLLVLMAGLVTFAVATPASADTFTLSVANANLASQGAGPYATVEITGSGTSWSVSASGLNGFVFGANNILDIDVASGTASLVLGSCSFSPCSDNGSGNVSGFGTYDLRVNDGPGFSSGGYSNISFDFTTSTSFASVSAMLGDLPNIAAHMALGTNTACTGFAADGGSSTGTVSAECLPTPEPTSLVLLGAGLFSTASAAFVRRKTKKTKK
jgi:PEP-CTERM motif